MILLASHASPCRADALVNRRRRFGDFGPLMADMSTMVCTPSRDRGRDGGLRQLYRWCAVAAVLQQAIATEGWRHTYLGVGVFCVLATLPFIFTLQRRAPVHPIGWMLEATSTGPARNLGVSPNALMVLLCVAGLACC